VDIALDEFLFLTLDGVVAETDTLIALTPGVVPSMPISYATGCYKEQFLRLQKVPKILVADLTRDVCFSVRNNKEEEFTHFSHKLKGIM